MNYFAYGNSFPATFPLNGNQNFNQVMAVQPGTQNLQLNSQVTEQSRAEILWQLQQIRIVTCNCINTGGRKEEREKMCNSVNSAVQMIETNANAIIGRYEEEIGNLKRAIGTYEQDNKNLMYELQAKDSLINSLSGQVMSPEKIKEIARIVVEETVKRAAKESGDWDSLSTYSEVQDDLAHGVENLQISMTSTLAITSPPVDTDGNDKSLANVESANAQSLPGNEIENTALSVGVITKQKTGFAFFGNSVKTFKLVNQSGKNVAFAIRSRRSLVTGFGLGVGTNQVGGNVCLDRSQKVERNTLENGKFKLVELDATNCTLTLFERLSDSKLRVFFTGKKISQGQKFTIMERHVKTFVTEVGSLSDLENLEN